MATATIVDCLKNNHLINMSGHCHTCWMLRRIGR